MCFRKSVFFMFFMKSKREKRDQREIQGAQNKRIPLRFPLELGSETFLGSILERSRVDLDDFLTLFGHPWPAQGGGLGRLWVPLGSSWVSLGCSWGGLGMLFGLSSELLDTS